MRIAFFVPYFGGGGVERTTLLIMGSLLEMGHAVDLVTLRPDGPFLSQVPSTAKVVDLKAKRTLTAIPSLICYLRHQKPDGIISLQSYANVTFILARMLARSSTPLVVSERLVMSAAVESAKNRREAIMPLVMRWLYPRANAIVGNSNAVADDLATLLRLPHDRVHTIYNPTVAPDIFQRAEEQASHAWPDTDQTPVILGVGRLTRQKDFPTLLRAFAQVRESLSVRLIILGEGEERAALEALSRELDIYEDVDLPGFIENPYPFMKHASLFVLSSLYEGLPNVLIESLALGTPCVSTDCPGGSREILLDGEAGELVPVGDVGAMAHAMRELLTNPVRSQGMVQEGQRALDRFSPERCTQEYLSILQDGKGG